MFPAPNPLRVKLLAGEPIAGIYIQTNSPDCVELAAAAGLDYVILDEEHGSFGMNAVVHMIRAAEASGIVPIVRVPQVCATAVRRAVEAGALGVYVPDVRSAAQARAMVAAAKFGAPAAGQRRGACPTVRSARGKGAAQWEDYARWCDENLMVALLIESGEGLAALDQILAVPGIDTIVLGRFDLVQEMALEGGRYGPAMNALFDDFARKADAAGVPYVARWDTGAADSARQCAQALDRGARIFNVGSDRELMLRAFRGALASLR